MSLQEIYPDGAFLTVGFNVPDKQNNKEESSVTGMESINPPPCVPARYFLSTTYLPHFFTRMQHDVEVADPFPKTHSSGSNSRETPQLCRTRAFNAYLVDSMESMNIDNPQLSSVD
jgi:hypothetical protein